MDLVNFADNLSLRRLWCQKVSGGSAVATLLRRAYLATTTNHDVRAETDCEPWERRRLAGLLPGAD
jgi:hypothetical protein